jgi:hypothetical protein
LHQTKLLAPFSEGHAHLFLKQSLHSTFAGDAYRIRAATQLDLGALERAKIFGSSLPLEREELEKLMEKS